MVAYAQGNTINKKGKRKKEIKMSDYSTCTTIVSFASQG